MKILIFLFKIIFLICTIMLFILIMSKFIFAKEICVYGDCKNGKGIYEFNNGDRYIGEFKNGAQEGYGSRLMSSGYCYTGQWKNGLPNGWGILNWKNLIYIGQWSMGYMHGYGKLIINGKELIGRFIKGEYIGGNI